MKRMLPVLLALCFLFAILNVKASSYTMTFNTSTKTLQKNSNVDIYVLLSNINGISNGLNVCEFELGYDEEKVTINSIIGENNWNVTQGEKIIVDSSNPITTNSNVVKINVKVMDSNTLTIKNINCTDGDAEYSTVSSTVSFIVEQNTNNMDSNVNSDNNNVYNSSDTVNGPETGVVEFSIVFFITVILLLFIRRLILRMNLFKKI